MFGWGMTLGLVTVGIIRVSPKAQAACRPHGRALSAVATGLCRRRRKDTHRLDVESFCQKYLEWYGSVRERVGEML